MLHFSCDLCGQTLQDERFIVRVETYSAAKIPTGTDVDIDHLDELASSLEEDGPADEATQEPQQLRFDLCPTCHQRYLRDPLGREFQHRLRFSKN